MCLLSVSAVSAIDNTMTNVVSLENVNDELISIEDSVSNNNDILSVDNQSVLKHGANNDKYGAADIGNYSGLSEEIARGGNIELQHDYYIYDSNPNTIVILGDNRVIDGKGAVIDMSGSDMRAFQVNASGITIKNLTIKNAKYVINAKYPDDDGGALYFTKSGTLTYCNFINNTVRSDGGAIYFDKDTTGTLSYCNFINNTANLSHGGAVSFGNNGFVTNCTFVNNVADDWGGAIKFGENATLRNCKFYCCSASRGGAIYLDKNAVVEYCDFINNSAFGQYSNGGAIVSSGSYSIVSLTDCNFMGNNAPQGSAIYFYIISAPEPVIISNSHFLNNRADPDKEYPFSVYNEGNGLKITFKGRNNFINAIHSEDYYGVTEFNFTNVEYWGAEGIINTDSHTPSKSEREAGQNITVEIYDSNDNLVDNVTLVTDDNGQVTYDFIKLINGNYKYKVYHSQDCYYTYAEKTGTFTLNSDLGDFNRLQKYINDSSENSTLTLCCDYTFTIGSDENLVDGIIINKQLTINGNGHTINALKKARIFNVTADNVVLNNITFTNATSSDYGGALYFSSLGSVENCNFTGNTASGNGGAVYFRGSGDVSNCNFTDNSANYGGAIFIYSGNVSNCNFTRNTISNGDGGAVYMYLGNVTNCNFANNLAFNGEGGAGFFIWSNCNLMNCNFTNNSAKYTGGAVYLNSGSFEYCNFVNNSAGNNGGAVYCYDTCNVIFCNFMGNYADYGSAFYFVIGASSKIFSNTCFLNNKAKVDEKSALKAIKNGTNIEITFSGHDNHLNAIYSNGKVICTNVTYWGACGINNTGSSPVISARSDKEAGQNITVKGIVNDRIINTTEVTDENGMVVLEDASDYWIIVSHDDDSYYTKAGETIFTNIELYVNVTSLTTSNRTVNLTAKSNIYNEVMFGKLLFILQNGDEINASYATNGMWWALHTFDDAGDYEVNASYSGLEGVIINNATIIIRYDASVSVNNETVDLKVGDTFTIDATTVPKGLDVTYVPDDSGVYSVDENGVVTALKNGTGSVLVKVGGDGKYAENSTIVEITVTIPLKVVNINSIEKIIMIEGQKPACDFELQNNDTKNVDGINVKLTAIPSGSSTANTTELNVISHDGGVIDFDLSTVPIGYYNAYVTVDEFGYSSNTVTFYLSVHGKRTAYMDVVPFDNLTINVGDHVLLNATLKDFDTRNPIANATIIFLFNFDIEYTNVTDAQGNAHFDLSEVPVGEYLVNYGFGGNDIYYPIGVINNDKVTVSKIATEINIANASVDMEVNDVVPTGAALTPADAGNVAYAVSDSSVVKVKDGKIIALAEGEAVITVSFAGNDKYAAAENKTIEVTVNLKGASVSVNNESLSLKVDDAFAIVATTAPEGLNVTYVQDDSGVYIVDEDGVVTALKEGKGSVLVKVGGDGVYAENSTVITVTVSKIATEINIANASVDMEVNDVVPTGAALTPADAGNVAYAVSDSSVVKVKDGKIIALAEGEAVITVSFAGNDKYAAAENKTIEVYVSLKDASVSVNNESLSLKVGDTFTIVATTVPEGLDVTYVPDDSGVYSVDDNGIVTALKEGTASITVKVGGNGVYAENSTTVSVSVNKVPTEITVDPDSLDLFVGDETVVVANLTPSDAGNVTFTSSDDSVVIVDDRGNVIANGKGQAIITVSFAGNDKYAAAENKTITVNVRLNDASVTVDNNTLDLKVDETCAINATKHPDTILLDITYTSSDESVATVDKNGVVTAVGEGTAIITVEVGDDEIYAKNSTTVTVTVSKISTEITVANSTLDVKVLNFTFINATLTPGEAGNLTYNSSNSSVAVIIRGIIVPVGKGTAVITVSFAGNGKYAAAENKTIAVNVSLNDASVSVDNDTLDLFVEDTYVINATTVPAISKLMNLTYTSSDESVATVDENGTVTAVGEGTAIITLTVGDDIVFAKNSTTVTVNVNGKIINVSAPDVTKYYNGDERFVVIVTDSNNNPLANQSVKISVNDVNYTRITDENGIASIAVGLVSGQYNVTTIACNKTVYSKITVLPTVNATDLVKVFRNGTQFYATFKDSQGNYLSEGTMVRFNINGVMYDRKVSGDKGLAKLNINLNQGQYIITSMNLKTGENTANNVTVISRLIENRDLTKYFRNDSQYTVKVIGDDGKAVGAGESVTFNVNGVFYTRVTNELGIAKLNINLQPRDYVITAEYDGCMVSNNIHVLPVLYANDLTKKYGTPDQFIVSLVDGQGKPYAGQVIQFNVNGVIYNWLTVEDGKSKLNIRLMPGKYIITSSYMGTSIANNITVFA